MVLDVGFLWNSIEDVMVLRERVEGFELYLFVVKFYVGVVGEVIDVCFYYWNFYYF